MNKNGKIKTYPKKVNEDFKQPEVFFPQHSYSVPTYIASSSIQETNRWRPNMREGCTFVYYGKRGFLYGGVSSYKYNDLVIFDTSLQLKNLYFIFYQLKIYGFKVKAKENNLLLEEIIIFVKYLERIYIYSEEKKCMILI